MKPYLLLSFLAIIALNLFGKETTDSLYKELDKCIENSHKYTALRDYRIQALKQKLSYSNKIDYNENYLLNMSLYDEYKTYVYDSAVYYLNKNIELAQEHNDSYKIDESKILLSYLLSSAGMYKESADLLDGIKRSKLDNRLIDRYYISYDRLYTELSSYTQYSKVKQEYIKMRSAYRDSLMAILPQNSEAYYNIKENRERECFNLKAAMSTNDLRLKNAKEDTPIFSLVAFFRAINYRAANDVEMEKYWLAKSAISDIKCAVKDHASLWMLAEVLYKEGDIERAHRYINFSWAEIQTFHSRLRNLQTSEILSDIGNNYQELIRKSNSKLRTYLGVISILVLLLSIAIAYVYKQMKVISRAKNNLRDINNQLSELNEELSATNHALNQSNQELFEANRIKEEYIGRFFSVCSIYIDKLDSFRKMVTRKISSNQTVDLLNITRSLEFQEKEVAELHENFDSTFLHIFPNFIPEFNKLLLEDGQIKLSNDEKMNPELRIFALIRLGIEDSSKIADFLHYSPNTIYNYRARVKNKSRVPREEFEEKVKMIGAY